MFTQQSEKELKTSLEGNTNANIVLSVIANIAESSVDIWKQLTSDKNVTWHDTNVHNHFGETTKDIDLLARQLITSHIQEDHEDIAVVTEEDVDVRYPKGPYVLFVDPIDGSKHIQYDAACGTFFSLVTMKNKNIQSSPIVSGYALYGYHLSLVLALGQRLMVCAYDLDSQRFTSRVHNYSMPKEGTHYSINDADINDFPENARSFVQTLRKQRYKSRYNGVLVADLHRILTEGGIFISPQLNSGKVKAKKYFEAIAISYIMRAAGGLSLYDYRANVNALESGQELELFGSVPLIFGSKTELERYRDGDKSYDLHSD